MHISGVATNVSSVEPQIGTASKHHVVKPLPTMNPSTILLLVALVGAPCAHCVAYYTYPSTGHFRARQVGNAFKKVHSDTDTETGITNSGIEGLLANSGMVRGAADAQNANGGFGRSAYVGDLSGTGGLWYNTNSQAGPSGQNAKVVLDGYLNDDGAISGSIGAGAYRL